MTKERRDYVEELVNWHFAVEPELQEIYWVNPKDGEDAPICLLEVSGSDAVGAKSLFEQGEVGAFHFEGTEEFPYTSLVAEVTRPELRMIARGMLHLPPDFRSPFDQGVESFPRPKVRE